MQIRLMILVIAGMLILGCEESTEKIGETKDQPRIVETWQVDDAFVSQLSPRSKYIGFSIQPARGFGSTGARTSGRSQTNGWVGPKQENGVSAAVALTLVTPPNENEVPDLDESMRKFLDGIKKRRTNWEESETTYGEIDGAVFAKNSWTGVDKTQGVNMTGTIFVGIVNDKLVSISIQDAADNTENDLARAEASALTFRMEQPETPQQ